MTPSRQNIFKLRLVMTKSMGLLECVYAVSIFPGEDSKPVAAPIP